MILSFLSGVLGAAVFLALYALTSRLHRAFLTFRAQARNGQAAFEFLLAQQRAAVVVPPPPHPDNVVPFPKGS